MIMSLLLDLNVVNLFKVLSCCRIKIPLSRNFVDYSKMRSGIIFSLIKKKKSSHCVICHHLKPFAFVVDVSSCVDCM